MTPLHFAANAGHLEVVRALLKAGAKVNAADEHLSTPFHWACANRHLEVVRLLTASGADANAADQVSARFTMNDIYIRLLIVT
jgi:ankyrin repeat protein